MAKVPTERVTVRLNKMHLSTIDALIQTGQLRNRTHAIAEAVRDYVNKRSAEVKDLMGSAKAQVELQTMAAQMAQMQAQLAKLQKK